VAKERIAVIWPLDAFIEPIRFHYRRLLLTLPGGGAQRMRRPVLAAFASSSSIVGTATIPQ
jgi:hypothetical protein